MIPINVPRCRFIFRRTSHRPLSGEPLAVYGPVCLTFRPEIFAWRDPMRPTRSFMPPLRTLSTGPLMCPGVFADLVQRAGFGFILLEDRRLSDGPTIRPCDHRGTGRDRPCCRPNGGSRPARCRVKARNCPRRYNAAGESCRRLSTVYRPNLESRSPPDLPDRRPQRSAAARSSREDHRTAAGTTRSVRANLPARNANGGLPWGFCFLPKRPMKPDDISCRFRLRALLLGLLPAFFFFLSFALLGPGASLWG